MIIIGVVIVSPPLNSDAPFACENTSSSPDMMMHLTKKRKKVYKYYNYHYK